MQPFSNQAHDFSDIPKIYSLRSMKESLGQQDKLEKGVRLNEKG
jgi:hypothetical protein